jgi:tetratricopeptide (TPR) repeat protein
MEELFRGTERFEVLACLGAGGMGIVYEARDRRRGGVVALKTLRRMRPDALLRLKHEFRALRGIRHPNLASLYELCEDAGQWFFTMELVPGTDALRFVRGDAADPWRTASTVAPWRTTVRVATPLPKAAEGLAQAATGVARPAADGVHDRARDVVRQLARALCALHAAGKVHRDVKPTNVLVTAEGRVVVLDFGLVAGRDELAPTPGIVGTVHYMAPEQAAGAPVGCEADWYATGVMLFELCTGVLPFADDPSTVLRDKQQREPPRPSALVPGVPEDLDALCAALCRIDPAARPTGIEVLERLSERRGGVVRVPRRGPRGGAGPGFVGRERELGALADAFFEARAQGRAVACLVIGEAGAGKTALLDRLASALAARLPGVVWLAGGCFERETVPYRALDGVVDGLGRWLALLSEDEIAALLPGDAWLLPQLFAVLGPAVERAAVAERDDEPGAPAERRTRAFAAFRELVARVAQRWPLALGIDDLHRADADGLALLEHVLAPPAPPLLLVGTTAPDRGGRGTRISTRLPGDVRLLFLDPHAGANAARPLDDEALGARVAGLDAGARALLEIVSIADGALALDTAAHVAAVDEAEIRRRASILRKTDLVELVYARGVEALEPRSDRVRSVALAGVAPDVLAGEHRALALAIEATEADALASLAVHWQHAGELGAAERCAIAAAEQAEVAFAFDRAARLYEHALALSERQGVARPDVRVRLGDALANAGRGREAARAYLVAADAPGTDGLELQRQAAEQLLRSGHVDAGVAVARDVVGAVGLDVPRGRLGMLAALARWRLRAARRGLDFVPRAAPAPADLRRVDACWTLAHSLGTVDNAAASLFQTMHLCLALDAGDPYRAARALAIEAPFLGAVDAGTRRHARDIIVRARRIAESSGHPRALGHAVACDGWVALQDGRWARSVALLDEAAAIFRERCDGVAWELTTTELVAGWGLALRGRLDELARRTELALRECAERGDVYTATNLRIGFANLTWLARDDVQGARAAADEALAAWGGGGFHVQHWLHLFARANADLYAESGCGAHERLARAWPGLRGSLLLVHQLVRVTMRELRARAALAASHGVRARRAQRLLGAARADAARLAREGAFWSDALALAVEAGVARRRGDPLAAARYADAARAFDAADMALHAAAMELRRGELAGGAWGERLVRESEARLRAAGARNPARLVAMLAP